MNEIGVVGTKALDSGRYLLRNGTARRPNVAIPKRTLHEVSFASASGSSRSPSPTPIDPARP